MASFFKKLFGKGNDLNHFLGIDIGSSAIKMVQFSQGKNRLKLDTYGVFSYGEYLGKSPGETTIFDDNKLGSVITELAEQAQTNENACAFSLPIQSSLLSVITFPATIPVKNLDTAVPIEARKHIPVPIKEVELDWVLLPPQEIKSDADNQAVSEEAEKEPGDTATEEVVEVNEDEETEKIPQKKPVVEKQPHRVLTVAIHRELMSKYGKLASTTHLQPLAYELEMYSALRATVADQTEPIMLIDLGASATKIYVARSGYIERSHTSVFGGADVTRAVAARDSISFSEAEAKKRTDNTALRAPQLQDSLEKFLDTLVVIKEEYNARNAQSIKYIRLLGGASHLPGLCEKIASHIALETDQVSPFAEFDYPEELDETLHELGPDFAIAIGLALRLAREN